MNAPTVDQAVALQQAGDIDAAAAAYAQLLAADPRQPALRHNLGRIRLQQGATAEALPLLEQAWAEDGAHDGWLRSLGTIGITLYDLGLWEDAWHWLSRAAARAPAGTRLAPALTDTLRRVSPRDYLAPEVYDPQQGRTFLRHVPRESDTYVYAIDVIGTCPVGNFAAAQRPKGFMKAELFGSILDKIVAERVAPRPAVCLFNRGEPMLHPALPELVQAVRQRGLPCHLSTDLNVRSSLRELARASPDKLKISLSGFRPELYACAHARSDLALILANMRLLRQYLDEAGADTHVWVGHHSYKGGEAELPAVESLCDELGFAHHPVAAFYQPLERLVDLLEGRGAPDPELDLPIEPPRDYVTRIRATSSERHDCELRFNQTVINQDGSVALCCGVYDQPNMLGLQFVATPHSALEEAKYRHPFCATCMRHGLSYTVRDALKPGGFS